MDGRIVVKPDSMADVGSVASDWLEWDVKESVVVNGEWPFKILNLDRSCVFIVEIESENEDLKLGSPFAIIDGRLLGQGIFPEDALDEVCGFWVRAACLDAWFVQRIAFKVWLLFQQLFFSRRRDGNLQILNEAHTGQSSQRAAQASGLYSCKTSNPRKMSASLKYMDPFTPCTANVYPLGIGASLAVC